MKRKREERGVELIELAFVLPLLLLISLGTIEFGRAYYTYNILSKALRDGARYAATSRIKSDGTWVSTENPSVDTRTKNLVIYGNVAGSGNKVIPDLNTGQIFVVRNPDSTGNTGVPVSSLEQYIMVRAAYTYTPMFAWVMPTTLTFRPSVKMLFIGQIIF